ncbi:MAG: type VI secretion system tube protein TssD, partial [Candidatus Hodarchaeales archaeon]
LYLLGDKYMQTYTKLLKVGAFIIIIGFASSLLFTVNNGEKTQSISQNIEEIEVMTYLSYPRYMTVTGTSQGAFDGDVDTPGKEKTIDVLSYSHKIHVPTDPNTGQQTGVKIHSPFRIFKRMDASSPKFAQACYTGETLTGRLDFYRVNSTNHAEHYYTIELQTARVISITPQGSDTGNFETIAFVYSQITWTYVPEGISVTDTWSSSPG